MNNKVQRKKRRLGFAYGTVAGLAFAIFAWGVDAIMLARANASFYWIKFVPGLIISMILGGIAGWLTIWTHSHGYAFLFWGLIAFVLSWLVVWLPFAGAARLIKIVDPSLSSLINYSSIQDIGQFRLISFLIVGAVSLICGLLELNLIDQAILSPYISGSVFALAVCIVLFGIAGSATDHMINTNLREPVQIINSLLQFAQDNVGVEVPKTKARQMHLSAANQLGDLVLKPRRLTLISIDENLVMMDVLVDFEGTEVKCATIFSQPTDCIILTSNP
jgi:MFS family permease